MGRRARPPSSFADHAWVQTLDPGCTGESVPRSPRVEATTTLQTTLMSFDNHRLSGANSTSTTLVKLRIAVGSTHRQPQRRPCLSTTGHRTHPRVAARSEEHTSELQSLMRISYAVFCLKKKN